MITLNKITKSYKNNTILQNCSYDFKSGKKYLITGDNGVGKSVLMKIIVGFTLPDSGEVIINNDVLGDKYDFLLNSGVSINAPEFSQSLSGLDNLLEIAKIKKIIDTNEILSFASIFDLDLNKKYATYSLGMKQKMRLIQAIMESPDILILDEPFDGLDNSMKVITKEYLDKYVKEKEDRIIIFTSHDNQSKEFADIILKIDEKTLSSCP